jgi:hypothetical protein
LQAQSVEFDDRNIRHDPSARDELMALTGNLVVPLVIYGEHRVVGFEPDGLSGIARAYHAAGLRP